MLTSFELEGIQYVAGPFGTLTPACAIYFRRVGQEYRIDYDQLITVWRSDAITLEALEGRIKSGDFLCKHNVYTASFSLATITVNKRPLPALIERIRSFLLDHAKSSIDAIAFAQAGETEFLKDCRRFKPSEYEERLLAKFT